MVTRIVCAVFVLAALSARPASAQQLTTGDHLWLSHSETDVIAELRVFVDGVKVHRVPFANATCQPLPPGRRLCDVGIPPQPVDGLLMVKACALGTSPERVTDEDALCSFPSNPVTIPPYPTATPTETVTETPTNTVTASATVSPSPTFSPTGTATNTATHTRTGTFTVTPVPTRTHTVTPTQSTTRTPSRTGTATRTSTSAPTLPPLPPIPSRPTILFYQRGQPMIVGIPNGDPRVNVFVRTFTPEATPGL